MDNTSCYRSGFRPFVRVAFAVIPYCLSFLSFIIVIRYCLSLSSFIIVIRYCLSLSSFIIVIRYCLSLLSFIIFFLYYLFILEAFLFALFDFAGSRLVDALRMVENVTKRCAARGAVLSLRFFAGPEFIVCSVLFAAGDAFFANVICLVAVLFLELM